MSSRGTSPTIRIGIAALLLIACIGGFVWLALPPKEPEYQGKPLSYWLERARTNWNAIFFSPKDPETVECTEAVRHIGTNAIPYLLRMLKAKDTALKTKAMDFAEAKGMTNLPLHSAQELLDKADVGFFLLGDLATNAIQDLIKIYNHPPSPDSKQRASKALIYLYPAAGVLNPYWVPPEERVEWFSYAGHLKSNLGSPSNAILAYSDAIKLNATNEYAYSERGSEKMDLRDFNGAMADFEKVMELSPRNESALCSRGLCKFYLKDFKGAEADLTTAITMDTNDMSAYNYRGLARANLRDLTNALADLNQAISLEPREPSPYRNRAIVEGLQKEYELALADLDKSIALNNEDSAAYTFRGRIQSALKEYPAAIADFDKAIELYPEDPMPYATRGLDKVYLNDFDNAATDLEKALQLDPKTVMAFIARGLLKAKRGEDDAAVLADFEQAVELGPQTPESRVILGEFQYKAHQWEQALANCRMALQTGKLADVGDPNSYIWLIRAQSGEQDAANKELSDYLNSLDPVKTNEWSAITARFFTGNLPESKFLELATTAAKRPSAVKSQVSESLYFAGMKRKIAGDTNGAISLFQRCVDFKDENTIAYMNARVELRAMKQP